MPSVSPSTAPAPSFAPVPLFPHALVTVSRRRSPESLLGNNFFGNMALANWHPIGSDGMDDTLKRKVYREMMNYFAVASYL